MNQPPSACAACRLCNVLFDDLDDARHHFSTAPHPIRAKDRRELGPREISHLIDSRIQVMALSDPSATSAWINSADAADAMQRVVRNPSVFEDPAVRSQMRDMAQTPARRGAQVVQEHTLRYAVEVNDDGAKTYHLVLIPGATTTYYGMLAVLERALPGTDVGALVQRRWVVEVSSRGEREDIQIRNAADVVKAMASRGGLVARKMIIG